MKHSLHMLCLNKTSIYINRSIFIYIHIYVYQCDLRNNVNTTCINPTIYPFWSHRLPDNKPWAHWVLVLELMAARLVDVFEIQHAAPLVSLSYNLRAVRQLQRINLPGERSQEVNGLVEFVNEKTSVPAVTWKISIKIINWKEKKKKRRTKDNFTDE